MSWVTCFPCNIWISGAMILHCLILHMLWNPWAVVDMRRCQGLGQNPMVGPNETQWADAPGTFSKIGNWNIQASPTTEPGLVYLYTFLEVVYYLGSTNLNPLNKSSHWRNVRKEVGRLHFLDAPHKKPLPKLSCFYVISQKFHCVQGWPCNTIQVHK